MSRLQIIVLLVTIYTTSINAARILGVYPTPSISHQVVFRALTLELVKRGHEVVTVTTDPAFKNTTSPANLTEIDLSSSYELLLEMLKFSNGTKLMKRGVIVDSKFLISTSVELMHQFLLHILKNDEVNRLFEDKTKKFDLIMIEGLYYTPLIFGKIFNAPVVLFSSFYGTAANYETVGAVSRHPILYPSVYRNKFGNHGVLEKIQEALLEFDLVEMDSKSEEKENAFIESRFGPNAPTIAELKKNIVLLLVNSHPILDGNRPVPPGTVYLGSLHLQPLKELPQDLKLYLDSSIRGVVYVSLGTNVRPSSMEKDFLDAFLDAFEALPYDILWKFDGDNLYRVPKNVKIQKWFPQRDLLVHPNVKVFVTQGGLQSTDEAIDAEMPLVGIPILGDQWYNTNKYVELGIGVQLDPFTLVCEDLVKAVNTVINDPKFKENIKNLKSIIQDQPQKPIDRAVWWIEHVLRHKGSRHLLGPAAQMTWSEYVMMDVVLILAVGFVILTAVASVSLYHIIKFISKINRYVKLKKS